LLAYEAATNTQPPENARVESHHVDAGQLRRRAGLVQLNALI